MTHDTMKFPTVAGDVEIPLDYVSNPHEMSAFCEREAERALASDLPPDRVVMFVVVMACTIGFTDPAKGLEYLDRARHLLQQVQDDQVTT